MIHKTGISLTGLLVATIDTPNPDRAVIEGVTWQQDWTRTGTNGWQAKVARPNAFINLGLNAALERMFAIGTTAALTHIGVSDDNTAVTSTTTKIDPSPGGLSPSIKSISPAATRSNQTVTAGATWTQADVNFSIRKVGLLNSATDAGTTTAGAIAGVWDIIGGSGADPYDQPFTIDLTGTTSFTLTLQVQVTAAAS